MKQHIVVAALVAMTAGASAAPPQKQLAAEPPEQAAIPYESAYAGYRRFEERELAPWRELNDEVARLGGGHAHMRSAPPREKAGAKEAPPAPSGHGVMDHGGHR